MEKFTCKEYVDAFIFNQFDKDEFRADYPEGLSVSDIANNDAIDVYFDGDALIDCGDEMEITDHENRHEKYEI